MSEYCARPKDGSELCDLLRMCHRALTHLRLGQFSECLHSWVPILEAYRVQRCPLAYEPDLACLIFAMKSFEEFWDAPEEELSSYLDILSFLGHFLG